MLKIATFPKLGKTGTSRRLVLLPMVPRTKEKWGRASENGKVGKAAFQRAQKFMYSNKIEKNANGKKKVR